MSRRSTILLCAMMALLLCGFGCRHAGKPEVTSGPQKSETPASEKSEIVKRPMAQVNPDLPRKQFLIEMEVLSIPKKAFAKMENEELHARLQHGAVIRGDTVGNLIGESENVVKDPRDKMLRNSETRILLRPRLLICDGNDGTVNIGEDGITPKMWAYFYPVSQPDGSVRLNVKMKIPALDKKGQPITKRGVEANSIDDELTLKPSRDRFICYRPDPTRGESEIFAFLRISEVNEPRK